MIRSFIFAPGNRPNLIQKFPKIPADCFVIDLEDGTPPQDKDMARDGLKAAVDEVRGQGLRAQLYVRVNEMESPRYAQDVAVAAGCAIDGIVLPKLEHAEQVAEFFALADKHSPAGRKLTMIAGVESMIGVINVDSFVAVDPRMVAAYFGAEDYAQDLQIDRSPGGEEVAYARARVALALRAGKRIAIDQAVPDIRDEALLVADSKKGKALGYTGKICVTPRQAEICNEAFAPSAEEVEHARQLLAAHEAAMAEGKPMIVYGGKMIVPDGPLVKRAHRILDLAEAIAKAHAASGAASGVNSSATR